MMIIQDLNKFGASPLENIKTFWVLKIDYEGIFKAVI